jgi:hypothetical protein
LDSTPGDLLLVATGKTNQARLSHVMKPLT